MSLTRFLPTPSDRMGILWSLLAIEDCIVLEYGPAGTTHFSMGLFGELGENQQNRLFTTHMSEDDVIMGDVTRLEKAIVELDQNFAPKVIFVVSSSVAAVIGSDIKGVCNYMQERVNARLIAFEQGGFRGDYTFGLVEVYKLLIQELVDYEPKPQENTFNMLGFSMGSYRALSDRWEIEDLLYRSFGLKLGACLCGETSIGAIQQMGGASLNLVLREEGAAAAKMLKKKFGTPTVGGAPYGYQGTLEWLEKISEAIGRPISSQVRDELEQKINEAAYYPMYSRMLKFDHPSVALVGEYRPVVGIGQFLTQLGLKPNLQICLHSIKAVAKPEENIRVCDSEKERLNLLRGLHRSLIMADDPSMSVCHKEDNVFLRISMPVVRGNQTARHLPLVGIRGADFIMETVEEYLQMLR